MENIPVLNVKFRFKNLENIVFANGKIWQLTNKKKYFKSLREIKPKVHLGNLYYRISGKRYSKNKLNSLAYKSIESICLINLPF